MKVFVTGATGALGRRVIRHLQNHDFSVVALSRSAQNNALLSKEQVEITGADLFAKDEIVAATKGCDAIMHLATHIPRKSISRLRDWQINDRIRTEGTVNLLEAAVVNKIKFFVGQSITAIYGQQYGNWVSTDTPLPQRQVEMAKSVIEMEKLITAKLPDRYVILRFASFYSENDYFTNLLIDSISKGKMPIIGNGDFYTNWIHLEDAASAILFALQNIDTLKGKTLNVSDSHPLYYFEMLNFLSEFIRHKKPPHLPGWLARLVVGKNNFAYLTNSYRVEPDASLEKWQPGHPDFIYGITQIVNQQTGK